MTGDGPVSDNPTALDNLVVDVLGAAARMALADCDGDRVQAMQIMIANRGDTMVWALLRMLQAEGERTGGHEGYRRRLLELATATDLRAIEREVDPS